MGVELGCNDCRGRQNPSLCNSALRWSDGCRRPAARPKIRGRLSLTVVDGWAVCGALHSAAPSFREPDLRPQQIREHLLCVALSTCDRVALLRDRVAPAPGELILRLVLQAMAAAAQEPAAAEQHPAGPAAPRTCEPAPAAPNRVSVSRKRTTSLMSSQSSPGVRVR